MKRVIFILLLVLCMIFLMSCDKANGEIPETDVPETDAPETEWQEPKYPADFQFSLTWNTYGISHYDSATGELIKTTDATNPDDYVTELHLTEEQKQLIWRSVSTLDLDSYPDAPDNYDPYPNVKSEPSQTVILTVTYNGESKTIQAKNIALGGETLTREAAVFLHVRDVIVSIIKETDEWKALPDYEFYYD